MAIKKLEENEVREFLNAIEKGTISLLPKNDPQAVYAGNVVYEASNGWFITIFNDANEWDYIDSIKTNDERSLDFDELEMMSSIFSYMPNDEIAWKRYGMPGNCTFRCKTCGVQLTSKQLCRSPYLCLECQEHAGLSRD